MSDPEFITSKSETIGVLEIRNLLETTNTLKAALTMDEYTTIMLIYNSAIERLLRENGLEI